MSVRNGRCAVRLIAASLALLTGAAQATTDSGGSLNLLVKAGLDDDEFVISRSNLVSRNDHVEFVFGCTGRPGSSRMRTGWRRTGFSPRSLSPTGSTACV